MIPQFNEDVAVTGTEKEFYDELVDRITGLASNITCDNDPADEFDVGTKGTSYIPKFVFRVNNVIFFKIVRPNTLANSVNGINVVMCLDGATENVRNFTFSSSSIAYDDIAYRKVILGYLISSNEKLIAINIHAGHTGNAGSVVFSISGNSSYISSGTSSGTISNFDLSTSTFYNTDSPYTAGKFKSRFSYATTQGTIDYIKSSVYTDTGIGDAALKKFDMNSIFDCTTVTLGSTVSLKDGNYYAVGTNQLVKIS